MERVLFSRQWSWWENLSPDKREPVWGSWVQKLITVIQAVRVPRHTWRKDNGRQLSRLCLDLLWLWPESELSHSPVGDTSIIKYSDPPKSRVPSERSGAAGGIARKKDRALESTKQGSALWLPCGRCLHAAPGSGHRYVYGILFSMTTLVFFSFLYIFNVSKS